MRNFYLLLDGVDLVTFYWHGLDPFLPVEGRATANQYAVALCDR